MGRRDDDALLACAGVPLPYLTRQVASGDAYRSPGQGLADYYTGDRELTSRWVGRGAADLAVSGVVREDQMRSLYGAGSTVMRSRSSRSRSQTVLSPRAPDVQLPLPECSRRPSRADQRETRPPQRARLRGSQLGGITRSGRPPPRSWTMRRYRLASSQTNSAMRGHQ
ncbi:relaxase domain-containing protein [Mumia zhuanghuii]